MESRSRILIIAVIIVCLIIGVRLFYIQIIDSDYKSFANNNALRYQEQIPPRGEVYDRNGEFLVQSRESYDLMCIPRDTGPFDTIRLAQILGVEVEMVIKEMAKARAYSPRRPSTLFKQLPKEVKLRLDERGFVGFYTLYRTVRTYPRKIAGNLLGYVSEVNNEDIKRDSYYKMGDYIGKSGIEKAYEKELRGAKGVKVEMVDVNGRPQGSYKEGIYDTVAQPGKAIIATIDAGLQQFAEEMLAGKVGAVVAIEPATGEILVMASSPTYDPDLLIGRERAHNYGKMNNDPRLPMFNRAVMASYPPGSTFKTVNGLIGMELGVASENEMHACGGRYPIGRGVECHGHPSPLDMAGATAYSCNAYFCYVLRDILDKSPMDAKFVDRYDRWREYVMSFGFGRKLDSDFVGELNGNVPSSKFYNERYRGSWNSLTVISLAIGQGEMGATPLQMANLAATIANRGYYYIPHVVKKIEGQDTISSRFYEKHFTKVDPKHFQSIVDGMHQAVNVPGGGTGSIARVEGLDICGKTGTSENPRGADHSVFMCFAPKNNPKIAVYTFIEHGRFGATTAAPIASLLIEKYLNGEVKRQDLVQYVKQMQIAYPMYDKPKTR